MADETSDKPLPFTREPTDPIRLAQRDLKKGFPKRFYRDVSTQRVDSGFALLLDGRPVRTPSKVSVSVPTQALADALSAEWRAQTECIDPTTMPLTRLVNSAIDGVAHHLDATIAEVAKFAETDLVCYRASDPEALVRAQTEAWDPMLTFAREALGARFGCAEGVMYVPQPETSRAAVRRAVEMIAEDSASALRLAALSVMTSLTGSVIIALAVTRGAVTSEAAWGAAHVDEDFQMRLWGADAEALTRRENHWRDMRAAALVFEAGGD